MFDDEDFVLVKQAVKFVLKHSKQALADKQQFTALVAKFENDFVQLTRDELNMCYHSLDLVVKSLDHDRKKSSQSEDDKAVYKGMRLKRERLMQRLSHRLNNWEKYQPQKNPQ